MAKSVHFHGVPLPVPKRFDRAESCFIVHFPTFFDPIPQIQVRKPQPFCFLYLPKHRKGAQDRKRGKLFTKLIRHIAVAARAGGDLEANAALRLAVDKAKAQSLPKDKIEAAIKRGSGQLDGDDYEEILYEGYGWLNLA